MSITRRNFIIGSASSAGLVTFNRAGWGQATTPAASPLDTLSTFHPSTAAAKALYAQISAQSGAELRRRLITVNADIRSRGLKSIPGIEGTFLTGYPYNEFYDWDLYFENLYLSYYGVWPLCFTNLKEFLDREKPDGYVNRSLIK